VSIKVTLDTREFEAAMRDYAKDSKRDFGDICNRVAFDVARWSIEETHKATPGNIEQVAKESWWPKYIAKRISRGGVTVTFRSKTKGNRRVGFQGSYTRAQAKSVSTKIIAARKRSRTFLAAGWLPAVHLFANRVFGTGARTRAPGGVKMMGAPKGRGIVARLNSWDPVAWIINMATGASKFSHRPNPSPVIWKGLQKAVNRKAKDLRTVIISRMAKTAAKYSAK
jgi:hypothetical protein